MTELDAHLLQTSIDECNKIRHGIQESILKCFPIGTEARAKLSRDVVKIWSTSANLGCVAVRYPDGELREIYWSNLEPINDSSGTP